MIFWLQKEYGISQREIESIELLNDQMIVGLLARRGILPAPLFKKSRKYVAEYISALARAEKRLERKIAFEPREEIYA